MAGRRISLPRPLDRLLDWFVPEGRDPHETRRRKIVVGFTLMILAWSPFYAAIYAWAFPSPYAAIAVGGLALGMSMVAAVPLLIRRGSPTGVSVGLLGFALGGLLLMMCWMTGGYRSPLLPWMVLHPLLALGLGGIRLAWVWTATVFVQLALLATAHELGVPPVNLLDQPARELLWGATLVTITLSAFGVGVIYEAIKNLTINELEAANHAKSDFLAHMSHEIRTPMTAILGFAEMLEDEKVGPEQAEHLRTIRRNGEHLLAVINDILDLSRVESGRVELEWGAVRPAVLVEEVAALIGPRARARGLDLDIEVDPALPPAIRSDATRLNQIVINLAANAVKFTERGRVRIAARREGERYVRFDVEDTGPGIPRDRLEAIFDAFAQGDASMSRRFGGTGLGLAISRRLARVLGGELTVRSELGRGSVFSLRVPNEPVASASAPRRVEAGGAESSAALHGRVLLAEDGADSRRLLVHLLERWGLEVEIAENGASAIELARRAHERGAAFELVLMDMQMPEMDGYEATRRLRSAGFRGPVIALTAHAMAGARDACIAAGCDDYLTKPIDRTRLRAALADWIGRESSGAAS